MLENGLNSYEERHWYSEKPECIGAETNPAVRLEATFIAQIIYLVGFATSLIFFTLEKFIANKKNTIGKKKIFARSTYYGDRKLNLVFLQ